MYKNFFKRVLDIILSLFALVFLAPLFLLTVILIKVNQKGSVFFYQQRPGKNCRVFNVIKFRTMTDERDELGNLLPDEKRITTIGKFIRSASLDEIPQLINVLKGDMSLIGPRPLLVKYLPLYNDFQMRRHEVRPGITGWAQVNGRNTISWDKKFELDVWYIDNISLATDVKIFLLTVKKVLFREGVSSETSATMDTFKGNY